MRVPSPQARFRSYSTIWGGGATYGLTLGRSIHRDQRTRLLPACLAACRLPATWPAGSGAFFESRA